MIFLEGHNYASLDNSSPLNKWLILEKKKISAGPQYFISVVGEKFTLLIAEAI